MGGMKRTADGIEFSHRLLAILGLLLSLAAGGIGMTFAGVHAADKIADAATRTELRDSMKSVRELRRADSIELAQNQAAQIWYNRQTWLLVCKLYNNPEAFCKEPDPSVLRAVLQAGRPR